MLKKAELLGDFRTALLVVDQQIDFEPGGALAVPGGNEIVRPISRLMMEFPQVVVTQDSHPVGHISFASSYTDKQPFEMLSLEEVESGLIRPVELPVDVVVDYLRRIPNKAQMLWPAHCIVGTPGWFLNSELRLERASLILRKGMRPDCDSYSAFFENDGTATGLTGYLRERDIRRLVLTGLAGDYCLFWTARDALREGFSVVVDARLTRFVDHPQGSRENALREMQILGVVDADLLEA